MTSNKIFRAISLVSLGTLISRFCGLGREVATANFFGTTGVYDAFLIAFMIPNFFRGILAEGALNAAFIPVFTEYVVEQEDTKKSSEIFNICFTASLFLTFTLFIIVFLSSYIAIGFIPDTSKWLWIWILLKFTFPYLIFISLAALNMGVLNVYKSFFLPSLSPVILDFFWISALFFLMPFFGNRIEEKIFGLCIGVIAGGIGQFLFTLIPVIKKGYTIKLNLNFKHPALKKIGKLLAPMIIGMAVGPINLLIDHTMANTLYEGAVSGLWYSARIYQLPLGIFAISISTGIFPWLSENVSQKNYKEFESTLLFSLKLLLIFILPFVFGIIILRTEIITLPFSRGLFSEQSIKLAAAPLAFYSIGLIGYGGISIITRAFYSNGDTITPVRVGLLTILANCVFNLIFMKFLGHSGIALSTALVGSANLLLLITFFYKKHLKINLNVLKSFTLKVFFSSVAANFLLYVYKILFSKRFSLPLFFFSGILITTIFYLFFLRVTIFRKAQINI